MSSATNSMTATKSLLRLIYNNLNFKSISVIPMSTQSFRTRIICVCAGIVLLAGCSVYRPDSQQGQTLKSEDIDRVTIGMSESEVREILGTPLVSDVFNNQRWDYIHFAYDRDRVKTSQSRVSIYFDDGAVASIEIDTELAPESVPVHITPEKKSKGFMNRIKSGFSSVGNFFKREKKKDEASEDSN